MWEHGSVLGRGNFSAGESPSNYQMLIDYGTRTDGQPVYVGFAPYGADTLSKVWLVQYFTYTTIGSNDFVATRKSTVTDWDDRATGVYA